MLRSDGQPSFRRAPSTATNASGIAASIVDAESLAQFPPPPDEIPLTPLLEHAPSPSRTALAGLHRSPQVASIFEYHRPAVICFYPRDRASQPGSLRTFRTSTSNASSGSRPAFAQDNYGLYHLSHLLNRLVAMVTSPTHHTLYKIKTNGMKGRLRS